MEVLRRIRSVSAFGQLIRHHPFLSEEQRLLLSTRDPLKSVLSAERPQYSLAHFQLNADYSRTSQSYDVKSRGAGE